MPKKPKDPKIKHRKLKVLGQEAMALMDYLVTEAVVRNQAMHYKLSVPYRRLSTKLQHNDGDVVIEIKVYYRGEFKDEPDESPQSIKVTGPDKGRH